MEIRQLKYFIAIVEAKSYSRAAESLFVTQPTLTLSMQKIEKEFDVKLFNQSQSGLQLTDSGMFLYENGIDIVQEFDYLVNHFHCQKQHVKETIRIGLTVLSAMQFMKQISQFIANNQNVEVRLIQNGSHKLQKMLADGQIDFGILSFPLVDSSIELLPLKNTDVEGYNVSVVMPSTNPLSDKKSISFNDLKKKLLFL